MSNWRELTEYNSLWVIDRDPKDEWFSYFDSLTQFELSRSARQFQNKTEPWIFAGPKYLPATLILLADFSENAIDQQQKIWRELGSPKTLIYSSGKSSFVKKLTSIAPESFHHVSEVP